MRRALARSAAALAVVLAGCVAGPPKRTTAGASEDPAERWALSAADAFENGLVRRGRLHADAPLELYLTEVAARLVTPEEFADLRLRVRILLEPRPTSSSLANGALLVTTGQLAHLESEAQLAAVLAHSVAHLSRRHLFRERPMPQLGSGRPDRFEVPSEAEFRRGLDLEADAEALAYLRQAGYDLSDAIRVLERRRDYEDAVRALGRRRPAAMDDRRRTRGKAEDPEATERASLVARIAACERLVAQQGATGGARNAEVYAAATAGLVPGAVRGDLAVGLLGPARRLVERRLELAPSDAHVHLLLGEVARRERTARSLDTATTAYRRALELDAGLAEAWRGLGLALSAKGDRQGGRAAFARYLELAPDAPDRAHVEAALRAAP